MEFQVDKSKYLKKKNCIIWVQSELQIEKSILRFHKEEEFNK